MLQLLLFSALLTLSSCLSRQYYFVNVNKSWTDAQAYCRQNYNDLATLDNANDQSSVLAAISNGGYTGNGQIWTGQYEDVQNSWKWYLDDDAFYGVGEKNYRNWGTNAPDNNGGKEMCTQMQTNGFWNDVNCNLQAKFICYNGTNNSDIMVNIPVNASAARQYCRQYFTDLASIRNQLENQQIFNLAGGEAVWIGLYRTRLWSDQSNSTYENWLSGEPNNIYGNEHCTTVWIYYSGLWNDSPCFFAYPFVCYRVTSTTTASTVMTSTASAPVTPTTTTQTTTSVTPITTTQVTTKSVTPTTTTSSVTPTTTTQLTTISVRPNTTTQLTTKSVTPTTTTKSVMTSTAFVPVAVIGSRVKITSARNLTQSEIENIVLNNLQKVLINRNLLSNISVRVTRVMKIT